MPLSWNEIRHNAHAFAKEWAGETSEDSEAQSFWNEFFSVFGVKRRTVASFEEPVKNLAGNWAFIDLFWPGTLLVEHKSRGKSLDKANSQAMEYIRGLKDAGRDDEIPRYIVVSDFASFALHDLEADDTVAFSIANLYKHVDAFAFIPGYKQHSLEPEDPINIRAVELLGDLHDALEDGGYAGHELERFLVRILFCLFADKTGIFERDAFSLYLQNHTRVDGSDLGIHLERFFHVLDSEENKRQKNLVEDLADLPHVNGELFRERLPFAEFNRTMRDQLIRCTHFDWSEISPAVFGSLFQSVMQPKERRQVGAHYTSERDILKVVRSLFLNELREDFEKAKGNKNRLKAFHDKLGGLRFLDPACGCGNFLVVTYRELRLLELDVLKALHGGQQVIDIHNLSCVDVDAMFGIEINEFPARIAEVAMWLVDHQMNQRLSAAFGQYFVRLPLRKSATIRHANALRINWEEVLPADDCSYVLGNPPFVGKKARNREQQADMEHVFGQRSGELDYVCCWYTRAATYINGSQIRVAFVSTNSITQGEQPGLLWPSLWAANIHIHFAHRTFNWQSEARGAAHVHVVIIGFGQYDRPGKLIWDYEQNADNPVIVQARHINPYLIEGTNTVLQSRRQPLCNVPAIRFGNMPNDDGNYLFTDEDKTAFLAANPKAAELMRPFLSTREYIHGIRRWCLWLKDVPPDVIRSLPDVRERVRRVREFREASTRPTTRQLALTPAMFGEIRQPSTRFILVPRHTGEARRYIPMAYYEPTNIIGDSCLFIENATLYHFGVLHSAIHMAWVKIVCGRIKSDYRYSNELVYNNFPWPPSPTDKQKAAVEVKAQAVLDVRDSYAGSSPAALYDPLTMPASLSRAHAALDRVVDACYRSNPFGSDRVRGEYLFEMYEALMAPLTANLEKKPKPKRQKKTKENES
ncbi:MAG: hypothetical protein P4L84_34280 [Isosphaeraceae bacterium]|nr:hypothetical protein [Isosphaeraceae bacterium]